MCIIAVKKAGFPTWDEETIRQMFSRNPDGAGLMYRTKKGMIHIEKGFMDIASLLDYVEKHEKTLDKSDVVLHCRISTSGKTDELGCHPYPVYEANNRISKDVKLAMAHNGMLDRYGWVGDKTVNDTQHFIKECLRELPKGFLNSKALCHLIGNAIGSNKLAFLDENGIHLFGEFENAKEGYWYSNHSYAIQKFVLPKVTAVTSKNRAKDDEDDDDFYSLYGDRDSDYFPDYDPEGAFGDYEYCTEDDLYDEDTANTIPLL